MAATTTEDTNGNDSLHQTDGNAPSSTSLQRLAKKYAAHLKAIISNLYLLIVQAHDYQGPNTQQAMTDEMQDSTCFVLDYNAYLTLP